MKKSESMKNPEAFYLNGKFHDWESGEILPDNWTGIFVNIWPSNQNTQMKTWFENGERAFSVI